MSILKNAIDSIIVGVEDYNMNDERRLISSTRNIYAGILLLFKHRLVELSPPESDEVLIKQKLLPRLNENKELEWSGTGKKTVDTFQIRERFKSLNIDVDWKRLDKINTYRNNIEHYYATESKESVQTLLSNSFLVIRDFIKDYLNERPEELLGNRTYNTLVQINEVHEVEREECFESYKKIGDEVSSRLLKYSGECHTCGSDLIQYDEVEIKNFNWSTSYSCSILLLKSYQYYVENIISKRIRCKSCGSIFAFAPFMELTYLEDYGENMQMGYYDALEQEYENMAINMGVDMSLYQ